MPAIFLAIRVVGEITLCSHPYWQLVECKWAIKPVGIDILADLERKSNLVRPELKNRQVRFALCSRSGFTPQLMKDVEPRSDVMLLDFSLII